MVNLWRRRFLKPRRHSRGGTNVSPLLVGISVIWASNSRYVCVIFRSNQLRRLGMNQGKKKTFVHIFAFRTIEHKPLLLACALLCVVILPWASPAMAHTGSYGPDQGVTGTMPTHVNPATPNSDSRELLARGDGRGQGKGKGRGNGYGQCDGTGSGQGKGKGTGPKDGTGSGQGAQDGSGPRSGTGDCPRNQSGDTGSNNEGAQ